MAALQFLNMIAAGDSYNAGMLQADAGLFSPEQRRGGFPQFPVTRLRAAGCPFVEASRAWARRNPGRAG